MSKVYLLIPFDKKDDIKKSEKISWDAERKLWYCDTLTEGLKEYELFMVDIPFDDKDRLKTELKSMKWMSAEKIWAINAGDYKKHYKEIPV
jgi:hypothetical protein